MCGIAGYWIKSKTNDPRLLAQMSASIVRRGPDGVGHFYADTHGSTILTHTTHDHPPLHALALAHRRYAVLDRSAAGQQPMQRGRLTIVFNGEIYNHAELRQELSAHYGHVFQSRSDTETLLAAWQQWGADCLPKLRGFFAFALHDAHLNTLTLARDPFGKAPLYWLRRHDALYFASDIRAILAVCPDERENLRPDAIADYLDSGLRDVQDKTFWQNIQSLPAGSFAVLHLNNGQFFQEKYWNWPEKRLDCNRFSEKEAISGLRAHLEEAVQRRLTADLPVGFTLSGGLDSSALLALACRGGASSDKWPVLTVRYADARHNESHFARQVVRAYSQRIEHIELDGDQLDLLDEWEAFLDIQEEPSHDPVLFTDFVQQRFLKNMGIGVCIIGSGSDELLAGYPSFLGAHLRGLWQQNRWQEMPADAWAIVQNLSATELLSIFRKKYGNTGKPRWQEFAKREIKSNLPAAAKDLEGQLREKAGDWQMNYWLRSLNKSYMYHPVEPRMPFLDVDLANFCFQLPTDYLIRNGWTKWVLRKAVEDVLPAEIVWRKRKMGFPFDTRGWLKKHENHFKNELRAAPENAWINTRRVGEQYAVLLQQDAQLLWRLVCFSAWVGRACENG